MLERRKDVAAPDRRRILSAAAGPSIQEARYRGLAEARAASELARQIIETESARQALPAAGTDEIALPTTRGVAAHSRRIDLIPVLIGIALGSLALVGAGVLAALLGFWR